MDLLTYLQPWWWRKSLADVFDEVLRVALVGMVDYELAKEQPGAVRPVCAEHRVVKHVVGGTGVTVATLLRARRSSQPAWLTGDVRVAKDHPHDVHVQRPTSASTIVRCIYTTSNIGGCRGQQRTGLKV